jgi:hypothetical protein
MRKVLSEDAVRRGLSKIDEAKGLSWLRNHLDSAILILIFHGLAGGLVSSSLEQRASSRRAALTAGVVAALQKRE